MLHLQTILDNNSRYDDFSIVNTGTGNSNYIDIGAYECQLNLPLHGILKGDFQNFSEAIYSLISLGIDGAITFNVQSGTYNEQFNLSGVVGESPANTITFQ